MSVLHILKVATSSAKKRCMIGFNWLLFRWCSRLVYGGSIVYSSNAINSLQISGLTVSERQQISMLKPNAISHWITNAKRLYKSTLTGYQNSYLKKNCVSQQKEMR